MSMIPSSMGGQYKSCLFRKGTPKGNGSYRFLELATELEQCNNIHIDRILSQLQFSLVSLSHERLVNQLHQIDQVGFGLKGFSTDKVYDLGSLAELVKVMPANLPINIFPRTYGLRDCVRYILEKENK